ncbi:MAG: hypothetical protein A2787_03705 [Omnitrophica WOR_2 bacterium RIFCSPHIGHO2_01_FULL_48_9]|nr:MAG: hypothetical protein A3D10_02930 [Omnitrophica WOR_2 bacterium RIFCSPHIGHO2_02_FULL_48_11]OGX33003.1 MAG: hypothetical protein A2787_03705 [Omnitrophica WOR_2 bacterium RIFCSPHIGHO2_01_FULL_48_9]
MKNTLVPIAVVAVLLACLLMFKAYQTETNAKKALDLERYQRITAEEKLQQTEMKVSSLQGEINSTRSKLEKIQQVLQEGEIEKDDLVSQIDSVSQEKAALEQRLKELELSAGNVPAGGESRNR